MKAFSSIKREFKALYKPRASDIKGREQGATLELEDTSRPGTAASGRSYDSNYADADVRASSEKPHEDQQHRPQLKNSAEEVAATVEDILASSRMSIETSGEKASITFEEIFDVELPNSPANEDLGDQSAQHEGMATDPDEQAEEVPALTFEEAQAIRDEAYITFNCEEADDYTQGPARFVLGTDGAQDCAVLLMTSELSARLQKALRKQHAFEQAEIAGLRQRQAFMRFENRIEAEIANCRTKIATVRNADPDKETEVKQQLEILELLLDDVQSRRQTVHMHLETQAEELRDVQAAANALIEEAYICARLMEEQHGEASPVIEELDLETEYAAYCEQLRSAHDTGMVAAVPPLDTGRDSDDEVPVPTEEEQARQEIINALWASKETLDQARRDFEERETQRQREFYANKAAADRNEPTTDDTPEAFDMRWVVRYRELTRELIDAEAAYASVKREAFEAGVALPFEDNETVFQGVEEGDGVGYTISKEQEFVDSVPSPTVRRWLAKVPEGVEVGSPSFADEMRLEGDEWEAEEVGISDSVSLVAEGRERARIDRWRQACVAEKQE